MNSGNKSAWPAWARGPALNRSCFPGDGAPLEREITCVSLGPGETDDLIHGPSGSNGMREEQHPKNASWAVSLTRGLWSVAQTRTPNALYSVTVGLSVLLLGHSEPCEDANYAVCPTASHTEPCAQ